MKNKILLILLLLFGTLLHIYFFGLNEVLKVPDSFAYLQMSHNLKNFSVDGFGTGWFWFLYSLPIAIIDFFIWNDFLSGKIINLMFFNIGWILLYQIGRNYLSSKYALLVIWLYFLSPALLHFNIHVLSENIYIPLFLGLVLFLHSFIKIPSYQKTIFLGFFIALMYLTRWEAFIYLGSLVLIFIGMFWKGNIVKIFSYSLILVISFGLFIFPYLFHLHSFTWEWWLTNKWASNLRQAELRWVERMDDAGFEQAVAELTPNKHHLIAWFAGGLKYDTPQIEWSLTSYITDDPHAFISRFATNQKKLYSKNLPQIIIGDAYKVYSSKESFLYKNLPFIWILLIPILLLLFWIYKMIQQKKYSLLGTVLPFFFTWSFFFTLFFTLNRYFLIFLPFFLICIVYGIEQIQLKKWENICKIWLSIILLSIYSLGMYSYYQSHKLDDNKYAIKKTAWEWLKENQWEDLRIMERFPITTYYSWTKERWLTPYTDTLEDIITYAKYNNLDILTVDTIDFQKYRPDLHALLDATKKHTGLTLLKIIQENQSKVILYKIEK